MAKKPSIVFLSSADFVSDLLDFIATEKLAHIKMVWTNAPKPKGRGRLIASNAIALTAKKHALPLTETDAINETENINLLKLLYEKENIDFALVIAYGKILSEKVFSLFPYGTFNIHFSLLPKYRGASPIQTALLHGEKTTGISIQKINALMDAGDVSLTRAFNIENLTADAVFKLAVAETKIALRQFFSDIPNTLIRLTPQNHANASYCHKISKSNGHIQKDDTAKSIYQKFLAYTSWPSVYFFIAEKKITITQMHFRDELISLAEKTSAQKPCLTTNNKKLFLLFSDANKSYVEIVKLKVAGKRETTAIDYLNGARHSFPIDIN